MQSRRLPDDGRARMHGLHIRRRRGDGEPGRWEARFAIPAAAIAGIAVLVLSCGDGSVEPTPPPAPVATTVTVSPGSATLSALGETAQLTAEVRDQNGQVMSGAAVAWATSDVAVAAVDASGQVTAAANGSATITATAGSVSGTAAVTVAQVVSAVAVSPGTDTLVAFGDTVRLVAEATDANGHGVAGSEFSWSSSDTLVARVDDSGLVESVGEGSAVVMATASEVTGEAELSVVPPLPTTIVVSPDTVGFTAIGQNVRLVAEVREQAGRVMAEVFVSWSSGDTLVVAVDSVGLVTAVGGGTTTVTAAAGDVSGSVVVTVTQSAGSVVVSPSEAAIALGDTLRLTAEAFDENGHGVDGSVFSWSSGDAGVARVDETGLVEGVAEGTARIRATAGDASGVAEIMVENPDRAALVALYEATDGPNWVDNTNWLTDVPLGEWYGVETDAQGRVLRLELVGGGLAGPIPPELGSLSRLASLDLHHNQLTGAIPPELGRLVNLRYLRLSRNNLSGSIPREFGDLENLRHLELWGLTGPIPAELGALANLETLDFDGFESAGPIPPELGKLANLRNLSISNSQLSGPIPTELSALTNLEILRLGNSQLVGDRLTGSIPPELERLENLRSLNLGGHNLTGAIPPELRNLAKLAYLGIGRNQLSGPIPPELADLADLEVLNLSRNRLAGTIPPELADLANLRDLSLDNNLLTGPIPPELADLANLRDLSLYRNLLTGPIPPELGGLANLEELSLSSNQLAGTVPPELGRLARLKELYLHENRLAGTIPPAFLQLGRLSHFYFDENAGLCLASSMEFRDWYARIQNRREEGPFCADADVLRALYEATGGTAWVRADNWLGGAALSEWYGVDTDSLGRVSALDLTGNGLSGHLPGNLGDLGGLTKLRVGDNALSGPLPASLVNTVIQEFDYANTDLCVSADREFRDWLGAIPRHRGTGTECPPISDRDLLVGLHANNGGVNWTNDDGWVTDAPLSEWYGVSVDSSGSVVGLRLESNGLAGPIPPGLGGLTELQVLDLGRNDLTGPIPSELGNLADLTRLSLSSNNLVGSIPPEFGELYRLQTLDLSNNWRLTGSIPAGLGGLAELQMVDLGGNDHWGGIPPELGDLTSLEWLELWGNQLTGPIPPKLGNLANLRGLSLARNGLTGPIPSELGGLTSLEWVWLSDNQLTGPIPPKLGSLSNLRGLSLSSNDLVGPIPPEFAHLESLVELSLEANELSGEMPAELGKLRHLRRLRVTGNEGLEGALPASFTMLGRLRQLLARGTGLCAPRDTGFLAWLEGIPDQSVALCVPDVADVYLTQAVQSRTFPVPLVADQSALLRVFLSADTITGGGATVPPVRATFYLAGRQVHIASIPGKAEPIPAAIDEGSLAVSANAKIPGSVIQPGLEVVVEPDPDGTLSSTLGIPTRIPETGRMAVDVRATPLFELTVVPFLWEENPDSSVLATVDAMAANPEHHELLEHTRMLLPFSDMTVRAHDPVVISSNDGFSILSQTDMVRVAEGGTGHYLGMMSGATGPLGVARQPGWAAFAGLRSEIIAHELGHNLSLGHAPCGVVGTDGRYPYPRGQIGAWGYNSRTGSLISPDIGDFMSYCWPPAWISDYHFTKALAHRTEAGDASAATIASGARRTRTLLLWGGLDGEGAPFLRPAFYTHAAPTVPPEEGAFELTGRDGNGIVLFSLQFDMTAIAHQEGQEAGFTFGVPVTWDGGLSSVTLTGPGGSAVMDRDTDRPLTILRDPLTGRIRAILESDAADAEGLGHLKDYEAIFSRGLPEDSDRRSSDADRR